MRQKRLHSKCCNVVILYVFKTDGVLAKVDAFAAAAGQDEDVIYSKSTSLQVNEVMAFGKDSLVILARCEQCIMI